MELHCFNEKNDLNSWGEVYINNKPATLTYSRVSSVPYNIWWIGKQRDMKDTENAPFISFESNEKVEIRVKSDKIKAISDLVVRPQSKCVTIARKDNEATFVLKEHGAYTFEIDGFHEALHIFYNPERDFVSEETKSGRKILHYQAGIHNVGNMEIGSHTSVIIDAGAVVYGSFTAINSEDIRICGYGIIDGSKEIRIDHTCIIPTSVTMAQLEKTEYTDEDLTDEGVLRGKIKDLKCLYSCIKFYNCKNFSLEGVILRDAATFCFIPAACENFIIDNVKTIGMWRYNSDGIDIFNCSNAVIKNCFLRNFDDCIVIKGVVGWDKLNNENILVENCVVWCDWGSALEIGAETNADKYNNIVFRNCDIIHASSAVMRIHHHNRAAISNVLYDGIKGEFTKYQLGPKIIEEGKEYNGLPNEFQPYLIAVMIVNDGMYGKEKLPGTIDGVRIINTQVYKDKEVIVPKSLFFGADDGHMVKNVLVQGVYVNGEKAADYDKNFEDMKFTESVKYE